MVMVIIMMIHGNYHEYSNHQLYHKAFEYINQRRWNNEPQWINHYEPPWTKSLSNMITANTNKIKQTWWLHSCVWKPPCCEIPHRCHMDRSDNLRNMFCKRKRQLCDTCISAWLTSDAAKQMGPTTMACHCFGFGALGWARCTGMMDLWDVKCFIHSQLSFIVFPHHSWFIFPSNGPFTMSRFIS